MIQTQTQKTDTPLPLSTAVERLVTHHLPAPDSDQFYTTQFVRDVNNAARTIFTLLTKKGKAGEDIDTIRESLDLDNSTLIEALNKLEKLKRIYWLDDATIVLSENLQTLPGEIHDIYIDFGRSQNFSKKLTPYCIH